MAEYTDERSLTHPPRPHQTGVERFLGSSPLGVIVRLLLLSLIVGFAMSVFGY
ncbi:MAG: hypothetical protein MO846_11955 [Candidatus Devosia symbiotica]|nr:hypothetical protein [Candidatus Devosia symbiotica]